MALPVTIIFIELEAESTLAIEAERVEVSTEMVC